MAARRRGSLNAMREKAERLVHHLNNPAYWGSGIEDNPDPTDNTTSVFDIWRWADSVQRRDIQSVIARVVAARQRYIHVDKPFPHLNETLQQFAAEANAAGHWGDSAGFVEAIAVLAKRIPDPVVLREMVDVYERAGNLQRQVWFMAQLAGREIFQGNQENGKKILADAYALCLNPRFEKGIGLILMEVSSLLEKQGRIREAHKSLVYARDLFKELHAIFSITARDLYRGLEDKYPSAFSSSTPLPPQTIDEFLTAFFAEPVSG